MRVLLITKFYYPRGGDTTYALALERALSARGHQVIPFAMDDPRNLPSPYRRYFVPAIDFNALAAEGGPRAAWRAARRVIYSRAAAASLDRLIREQRPEVAHAQNIHHQLSPSIFPVLRRHRVPLVWTLHDYAVVCPNDTLFTGGAPCERCRGRRFYQCAIHRCKKDSLGASLLAATAAAVHHLAGLYRAVDRFLAPSRFLRDKLIAFGWDPARLIHQPYLLDGQAFERPPVEPRPEIVYAGRLAVEKGVEVLLRAAAAAGIRLQIAGAGPDEARLRRLGGELGLGYTPWLGQQGGLELRAILAGATAVAVPSLWYENQPFSALEALALGTPVVASRIGGLPELIEDGEHGLLVPPGDVAALAGALRALVADREAARRMGERGRRRIAALCDPERHVDALERHYRELRAAVEV